MLQLLAAITLLSGKGLSGVLNRATDQTFFGLYQPNWFDLALLIPYFTVLFCLSFYGVHRYVLIYLYYKNKANKTTEPAQLFTELPRVTIQLPIFNEQFVVERLLECICAIDYPKDKLDIQLLDDSTDETKDVAQAAVERFAALGHPISYHHRDNREGYKAGALQEGLKSAKGEFVAIFDADFTPTPDFLYKTIHHFTDPNVAVVQTRWTHINRHYSLTTEVEAMMLDGHFVLESTARARSGLFFNFNGTAGVWRTIAIESAGGWQHDTLTEDTDLSYRAQMKGWKFIYLQDMECAAELPVEMTAFKTQQQRWAKGLVQTAMKLLPRLMRSDLPRHIKFEAFYHLSSNLSYPLMVILTALLLPAMIVRFYSGWFMMLVLDLPLFLASTVSVSMFYVMAQRVLFPKTWLRSFFYLPFLMAIGLGLTITNTKAVMEALFKKQTAFARTPKYRVESKKDRVQSAKYRKRLGWLPWAEVAIGTYFAWMVWYAVSLENYITVPFLLLFVVGYWYTGLLSIFQGRFGGRSASPEHAARPYPVGV